MATVVQSNRSWMGLYPEDRRFRWILLQVLLLFAAVALVVARLHVPRAEPEPRKAVQLPPRLVRVIPEPVVTTVPPVKAVPVPARKPVAPSRRAPPKTAGEASKPRKKTAPAPSPREEAASAGVLAMSDALAELQGFAPKVPATVPPAPAVTRRSPEPSRGPSVLARGITRGSAGEVAGVADRSVLGATGLPGKGVGTGRGIRVGGEGRLPGVDRSGARAQAARSQEEIQEVLDRHKSAMYRLYSRALRDDPGLQGKLVISITIAASGRVSRCSIVDSELGAATLEAQLVRLVRGIDFGNKPGAGVVTTRVPVEFFPR